MEQYESLGLEEVWDRAAKCALVEGEKLSSNRCETRRVADYRRIVCCKENVPPIMHDYGY